MAGRVFEREGDPAAPAPSAATRAAVSRPRVQPPLAAVIRRARANPRSLTREDVTRLHRSIGNAAVGRLLAGAASTNRTGLPDGLKANVEAMSGLPMDDVRVHRGSPEPARLQAHAYARGSEIHLGPGQERHLAHEAWHVVQQRQGRVRPSGTSAGIPVNEDPALEDEATAMGGRATAARPIPRDASADGAPARDPASPPDAALRTTVAQFARGRRRKHKIDRHGRKAARQQKLEGRLFDERPGPAKIENAAEPEDEAQKIEKSLPEGVVAEEFTAGLRKLGVRIFLSGGAAIRWQGGLREISDLDFRIWAEDVGFKSFNEPAGAAMLRAINQTIVKNSRLKHKGIRGGQIDEFAPIGSDALTIGTSNWFGVECSLSIADTPKRGLVGLTRQGNSFARTPSGDESTVDALSLEELQADKLKSTITRTKKGDDSVKKVAQDLFDFIDLTRLLNAGRADGEDATETPEHVDGAGRRRVGEYRIANLEGRGIGHFRDDDVLALMRARLALTAKLHVRDYDRDRSGELDKTPGGETIFKGGARGHALRALIRGRSTSDEQREELTMYAREIASIGVDASLKRRLRPWMQKWNQAPTYGPPKRGLTAPRTRVRDRNAPEYLLDLWPDGFRPEFFTDLSESAGSVVKILILSGGFRPLKDARKELEVQGAFLLSAAQFSRAFSELKGKGLVEGRDDGLHLSETGRERYGVNKAGDFLPKR